MLKKFFISSILVILTSFYLFPVSFSFLPEAVNSKMIMAGFGIAALLYDGIGKKSFSVPHPLLYAGILAFVFSLWCLFCIAENGTDDVSYARYWVSFFTWVFGAYAVFFLIRSMTGKFNLDTLIYYLTLVCVVQCILSELIDNSPRFQQFVDSFFIQGQDFMHDIHRLYGIGASLDTAGVRFSVVMTLIAHRISSLSNQDHTDIWRLVFYTLSFLIILVIGSIIARTTWVGAFVGLAYMFLNDLHIGRGTINPQKVKFWGWFLGVSFLVVLVIVLLYRNNPVFRDSLRFGFEGFFNWAETGVFRTDSMDKLNRAMWVWPTDTRSWIIGRGLFENWVFSTDIGYCRFTLYCGLIGLGLFSLFFLYNGYSFIHRFPQLFLLGLSLIALTFIIWVKVATDIFFIYALLFWVQEECTSSTT